VPAARDALLNLIAASHPVELKSAVWKTAAFLPVEAQPDSQSLLLEAV